jgi:hypothetical protein
MKVISYLSSVPQKNKSLEKTDLLKKFINGVNECGDTGIVVEGYNQQQCDVAVIQGWQHEHGKTAPHLSFRTNIIKNQHQNKKRICTADSNLCLFATDKSRNEPHHYLRYSFDGIFPSTGVYFDDKINAERWNKISRDLNIKLEDSVTAGKHILLCSQRNGGWSMGDLPVEIWIHDTIEKIKQNSDRKIKIRLHPKDKNTKFYQPFLEKKYRKDKRVSVSAIDTNLHEDLTDAWAVVNHNSSSVVGPIIMGYHSFITDPEKSQCKDVSNLNFSDLENPKLFDREQWLKRISMFHWNFEELDNGDMWRHVRDYVYHPQ